MAYADLAFANIYFGERLHTEPWDSATISDRNKALAMATRDINRLDYVSAKVDADQENEFPRVGQSEAPDDIKIACCEIALALLDGVDPEVELSNIRVKSDRFSGVGTTYDPNSVPEHIPAMIASARAWTFIKPWLREYRNIRISRVS